MPVLQAVVMDCASRELLSSLGMTASPKLSAGEASHLLLSQKLEASTNSTFRLQPRNHVGRSEYDWILHDRMHHRGSSDQ